MKAVDKCVAKVVEAAKANANGCEVADRRPWHADNAVNADGTSNTAHSSTRAHVVVSDRVKAVHDGILKPRSSTVLKLMLEQPAEMTEKPQELEITGNFSFEKFPRSKERDFCLPGHFERNKDDYASVTGNHCFGIRPIMESVAKEYAIWVSVFAWLKWR